MDPTLSGFALGLLLGAAKIGIIGTVAFGVAWWRTRTKLRRLEATLPDPAPARLEERLASVEQIAEYTASQMDRLVQAQDDLAKRLAAPPVRTDLPKGS